jgi:TetR/AcrR family fatty acid metabolism transcriptional regulator
MFPEKIMKSEKAQRRMEQVVDAAIRCIADKGYEHLTMQAISDYSGLSRGAINHYFKKKEDILVAVLDSVDQKLYHMVDDRIRGSEDIEDHVRHRLRGTFEMAKDDPAFMYVIIDFMSLAMSNPVHGKGIREFLYKYRKLAGAGLRPGLDSGRFKNVNEHSIGAIVVAVTIGIGIQWIMDRDSFEYLEAARIAEDMLIAYLEK